MKIPMVFNVWVLEAPRQSINMYYYVEVPSLNIDDIISITPEMTVNIKSDDLQVSTHPVTNSILHQQIYRVIHRKLKNWSADHGNGLPQLNTPRTKRQMWEDKNTYTRIQIAIDVDAEYLGYTYDAPEPDPLEGYILRKPIDAKWAILNSLPGKEDTKINAPSDMAYGVCYTQDEKGEICLLSVSLVTKGAN